MDHAYMVNKILAFGELFGIICRGTPNASIQINFPDRPFRSYLLEKVKVSKSFKMVKRKYCFKQSDAFPEIKIYIIFLFLNLKSYILRLTHERLAVSIIQCNLVQF